MIHRIGLVLRSVMKLLSRLYRGVHSCSGCDGGQEAKFGEGVATEDASGTIWKDVRKVWTAWIAIIRCWTCWKSWPNWSVVTSAGWLNRWRDNWLNRWRNFWCWWLNLIVSLTGRLSESDGIEKLERCPSLSHECKCRPFLYLLLLKSIEIRGRTPGDLEQWCWY